MDETQNRRSAVIALVALSLVWGVNRSLYSVAHAVADERGAQPAFSPADSTLGPSA